MSHQRYNILVIEDNPTDVVLLKMALKAADVDCDVVVIDDGGDAMNLAKSVPLSIRAPDLVMLDLNLPKHDGVEVLAAIRENPALFSVPVAVLSSSSSPRERARMESFGVSRYIAKPPDFTEFLRIGSIVRELLENE